VCVRDHESADALKKDALNQAVPPSFPRPSHPQLLCGWPSELEVHDAHGHTALARALTGTRRGRSGAACVVELLRAGADRRALSG
jgi:hypothetical protein